METTLGSMDEKPIIVDCPECRRVMWRNGTCSHGKVPEPSSEAPKEPEVEKNKGRSRK